MDRRVRADAATPTSKRMLMRAREGVAGGVGGCSSYSADLCAARSMGLPKPTDEAGLKKLMREPPPPRMITRLACIGGDDAVGWRMGFLCAKLCPFPTPR